MALFEVGKESEENTPIKIPSEIFTKHYISIGSSGSGKTVLSKAILEEAAINKIPSIVIDTQGDIASLYLNENADSLTEHKLPITKQEELRKNAVVNIFTPTSSKGLPISINPLISPPQNTEYEDAVGIFQNISASICKILGYDIDDDKGKLAQTVIYKILYNNWKVKDSITSIDRLKLMIGKSDLMTPIEKKKILTKLEYLSVGENELLFNLGDQIDIKKLFAKPAGKAKVNIFYLNSINFL